MCGGNKCHFSHFHLFDNLLAVQERVGGMNLLLSTFPLITNPIADFYKPSSLAGTKAEEGSLNAAELKTLLFCSLTQIPINHNGKKHTSGGKTIDCFLKEEKFPFSLLFYFSISPVNTTTTMENERPIVLFYELLRNVGIVQPSDNHRTRFLNLNTLF